MGDPKIDTVQGIYEAFGRGDVPAILEVLTDDLDFASEPDSKIAPWHGLRRNKQEVAEFFFGITVPATGKSGTMDIHHWFRFDADLVCFYRGTEDTALTADLLTA